MFKITKVDTGRCIVIYQTKNSSNEVIFYGLMESFGIKLVRCSQPFKDYGELVYEPQSEATIKNLIDIEIPKGNSSLETKIKNYIQLNHLMRGF